MLHWKSTRYNYHPSSSLCAMWFSLYKIGSLIRTSSGIKQPQYLWQKKTWCGIFLETSYSKYIWSNLWLILLKNWWSWAYMNTIDLHNKFSHNSNNEVLFLGFFSLLLLRFLVGYQMFFWEICYVCYQKKRAVTWEYFDFYNFSDSFKRQKCWNLPTSQTARKNITSIFRREFSFITKYLARTFWSTILKKFRWERKIEIRRDMSEKYIILLTRKFL